MRIVRHAETLTPALSQGRGSALAIGSFDGVHRAHAALLKRVVEEARRRNLDAAVLTFEPLPREFFAPDTAPARLTSLSERLALLAGLGLDLAFVERFYAGFASLAPAQFEQRLRDVYGA